ncbi:MAG: hypothetical protein ACOZIN_19810, partial [Myxococcota bacterium]
MNRLAANDEYVAVASHLSVPGIWYVDVALVTDNGQLLWRRHIGGREFGIVPDSGISGEFTISEVLVGGDGAVSV